LYISAFNASAVYCLLLLSKSQPPLRPVDYCFVSTIFLVCCCCCYDPAKVPATVLAAATFNACDATILLPLLFLVAYVLTIAITIVIG